MDKISMLKFITKEKFVKARNSGNYGNISSGAEKVIENAENLDILELRTQFGSALQVLSARKVDENRYCQLLKGN